MPRVCGSLVVVVAAACGSARLIHQDQEGGVIQLDGNRDEAMRDAVQLMTLQCGPSNFHLVSQGEEPGGTGAQTDGNGGRSANTPVVAWRIHYVCGAAGSGS